MIVLYDARSISDWRFISGIKTTFRKRGIRLKDNQSHLVRAGVY